MTTFRERSARWNTSDFLRVSEVSLGITKSLISDYPVLISQTRSPAQLISDEYLPVPCGILLLKSFQSNSSSKYSAVHGIFIKQNAVVPPNVLSAIGTIDRRDFWAHHHWIEPVGLKVFVHLIAFSISMAMPSQSGKCHRVFKSDPSSCEI
jgi:hypothetical protein